ncbi:MAG: helix-turn-helix domain-containing protein [Acholeplasmatales bacterium]|nr:helix-turn-helix domain-containing protein [Acholeplasmatales bacterium]
MKFGKKIKELRLKKGISQQDMADDFFVGASLIDKWEKDKVLPGGKTIGRLEEYFGVEENYFITPDEYKELVKKRDRKTLIVFISSACAVGLLIVFGILAWIYGANLADEGTVIKNNGYEYVVYEDTPFFGDGECGLLSIGNDKDVVLPDTITRRTGPFNKTYKVKYVALTKDDVTDVSITLPRYFEEFPYTYPYTFNYSYTRRYTSLNPNDFKKISVSKKNEIYDSREDCGCLIDTMSDTILYNSQESFIPNGVKVISTDSMTNYFKYNNELTLPDSVEVVEDFAFGLYQVRVDAIPSYNIDYVDFGSVKEIGADVLSLVFLSDTTIVLPNTLEKISKYAFYTSYSFVEYIYYEGTKEDWANVEVDGGYFEPEETKQKLYAVDDSSVDSKAYMYYYSETEPTEKNVYWHYGEDNKPVIWS